MQRKIILGRTHIMVLKVTSQILETRFPHIEAGLVISLAAAGVR